ncbi:DUF7288 family protein [Methanogenium organophilum]|uniref:Uncharacterized protein n=1 Tax=Methanogenium organophilum TaxID=2199 RepID=A0A9X9S2Q2_METOG|nr:hypothetical protein [Methanogenium organophilum]WAI00418.1 hypothetical protein OU421_08235 [Methanogenium organophilum]
MVMNDEGQLYTIEGITAGVIMLVTAFTIFNTGIVYTPGDAHITDMQIQQLGYDALQMMDTPADSSPLSVSPLASMVLNKHKGMSDTEFNSAFSEYLKAETGTTDIVNSLEFNATVYNRVKGNTVNPEDDYIHSYHFSNSAQYEESQLTREPAISVTRYVWLPSSPGGYGADEYDGGEQLVLLEVLIWRR